MTRIPTSIAKAVLAAALLVSPLLASAQGGAAAAASSPAGTPLVINQPAAVVLMQEFGHGPGVPIGTGSGFTVFMNYFKEIWPWLLGVCAGIAILQGVAGGIEIMASGSPDLKSRGGERLMWALAGLLMIGLSAIILNFLNPGAFVLS